MRVDQQIKGIDFFEANAPLTISTMIQLIIILEVSLKKSKQSDITAAFLHVSLEEGEKMLKKTLYGFCQALHAFWKYLVEKLEACVMFHYKLEPSHAFVILMTCYSGLMMRHISINRHPLTSLWC